MLLHCRWFRLQISVICGQFLKFCSVIFRFLLHFFEFLTGLLELSLNRLYFIVHMELFLDYRGFCQLQIQDLFFQIIDYFLVLRHHGRRFLVHGIGCLRHLHTCWQIIALVRRECRSVEDREAGDSHTVVAVHLALLHLCFEVNILKHQRRVILIQILIRRSLYLVPLRQLI